MNLPRYHCLLITVVLVGVSIAFSLRGFLIEPNIWLIISSLLLAVVAGMYLERAWTAEPTIDDARRISYYRNALDAAARTFREYERHHCEKKTLDGDAKARRNAQMAEMCEKAL